MDLTKNYQISTYDHIFASRTSKEEWRRILEFRNQPNFALALPTYAELMPQYFSDNISLNKVVTEAWRFEMLVYKLYLYDTRDPALPDSGLTLSNLQRMCAKQYCASKGRVLAILSLMRLAGFLHQRQSDSDAQYKYLEPSKNFIDTVEGWNNRIFRIIDAVKPDARSAKRHETDPRLGWNMRKRGAENLLEGWKLLDPFPEVDHFVSKDGGWMFLLHCVAEALRLGDGVAIAPVDVDLAAFGKRFSVSRSHLRRLLESAYANGLLSAPPRNGSDIRLNEQTVAAFQNCMASELGFYHGHAIAK